MEEPRAPSFALTARRRVVASSFVRRASRLALAGAGLVALLAPSTAAADKISDAQAECRRKSEGDACSVYGERGACVERTLERPNGRSKRWLECSPGKRPKRRPKPAEDRTIDAAGPAGVLPALTTGGEASTGDGGSTGSTGSQGSTGGEAPEEAAPEEAPPTEAAPTQAIDPARDSAEAAVQDAGARVDHLLAGEGASGCAIAPTPAPSHTFVGLLVALLGLRRRRR